MPGLISAVTRNGNEEMHCLQRSIYCVSDTAVIGDSSLLWHEQYFLRYISIIKVDVDVSVCLSVCGSQKAESEDKSLKIWHLF